MEKQQIEKEAAAFFECPTADKSQISTTSTIIFAWHISALAEAEMREKWADAEARRDELHEAIRLTIEENLNLADGDVCTLIRLKHALRSNT